MGGCVYSDTCTTIPVSLSDIHNCVDGVCYLSTIATIDVPIGAGEKACLEFISPDGTSVAVTLNVSIASSFANWNVDSCYYTDSVSIAEEGTCDCDVAQPVDCENCPAPNPTGDFVFCNTAPNSCNFISGGHVTGTACVKTGLSGRNKLKVCEMSEVKFIDTMVVIEIEGITFEDDDNSTYDGSTFALSFNGQASSYELDKAMMNITFLSNSAQSQLTPGFLVYDTYGRFGYSIMPDSHVNDINSYDVDKIGWYKSSEQQKINSEVEEAFQSLVVNCSSNQFFTRAYVKDSYELYINAKVYNSTSLPVETILYDDSINERAFHQMDKTVYEDFNFMENGYVFNLNGFFWPLGITNTGEMTPVPDLCYVGGLNSTQGLITSDWKCVRSIFQDPLADSYNYIVVGCIESNSPCGVQVPGSAYAFFGKKVGDDGFAINDIYENSTHLKEDFYTLMDNPFSFQATIYPTLGIETITWSGSQFDVTPSTAYPVTLYEILENGVMSLSIEFKNMTVEFVTTTIKPKITNAVQIGDMIEVTAYSLTTAGSCYIFSEPAGIIATQEIQLLMKPDTGNYSITIPFYNDLAQIGIRCYKNVVFYNLTVSYDQMENETNDDNGNESPSNNSGFNTFDWKNWLNPGNWPGWFSNWDSKSIWHWVYIIFLAIIGIIVAIVILKVLSMIITFRRRRGGGRISLKQYKELRDNGSKA